MKKNDIIQVIIVVVLTAMALIVFGCKTPQPIVQTEVKEVVVEREVRDTIVTILPDSASNVLIKEPQLSLQQASGNGIVRYGMNP